MDDVEKPLLRVRDGLVTGRFRLEYGRQSNALCERTRNHDTVNLLRQRQETRWLYGQCLKWSRDFERRKQIGSDQVYIVGVFDG